MLGTALLAGVAGVAFALTRVEDGGEPGAHVMPVTAPEADVAPPPSPAPSAPEKTIEPPPAIADIPDAGVDAAVVAEPAPVVVHKRPKPRPTATVPTGPKAVKADGTLLADDTKPSPKLKQKPKTVKPKPRGEVKVDDTVLAQ